MAATTTTFSAAAIPAEAVSAAVTTQDAFDIGEFVSDLTVEDDAGSSDDVSLEELQLELEDCKDDDVVANILSNGVKLREHTKGVENNLRQVELDSIQDYIMESDNLLSLHDQIRDCDSILSQMEALLSGFQAEIGSISSDIKILQDRSMDMGLKLKNRKEAESKLAKFVEDIIIPPRMIDVLVDGEVNDEYLKYLDILSKKLKFTEVDAMVKASKALKDVQPELEKLRQKAESKVYDFVVQKLYALRKPKTNIQILQQSVLLKYKYVISFLKEHGKEIYLQVRGAYVDTMNKVLSAHFRAYIQALEKLQLDIATASDLIGIDTRSTSIFSRGREPLKNRSAVFALGERINIVKEIDQPALIPHIAEASSQKYPYEVLFRSLHKLLMDTATSEYLFCDNFFGEESIFFDIFAGPFAVIAEHFSTILPNCYDAIGLMLMIRITHQHQLVMSRRRTPCLDSYLDKVNISLWPRFKMVFDLHLNSLRNANIRTLWEDDVHPHYVMRRYAEFTASLIHLNVGYGDGQLELNLDRLRMAMDDLIMKLAKSFVKPKPQTVFLINNYDMTIAVLKEASPEGGKIQMHFEELLKSNTSLFVEELLAEHFGDLIKFVKTRASEDPSSPTSERAITVAEVEPVVKDFVNRWKSAIELMHKDVITSFSNFLCGMEILRAALTQLLLYYTRLLDCIKKIPGGPALNKDLVSISLIMNGAGEEGRLREDEDKEEEVEDEDEEARTGLSGLCRPVIDPGIPDSNWWPIFLRRNSSSSPGSSLYEDEEEWFKHFFRLSKDTFGYICSLVREDLISRPPSGLINIEGRLLSVEKQVGIALRRLASGESQVSVGAAFGLGQSTVSQVTWRFIDALKERGRHHLKWPDGNRMQEIKAKFKALCGLPNCCGEIDATHVTMTFPTMQTSDDWCDQVTNYSMFVQGVVDDELRFLDIVTGCPGGLTMSKLLKLSRLFRLCECGERLGWNARDLAGGGNAREFIVGGAAYPLLPWSITPNKSDGLTSSTSQFNRVHESMREHD